MTAPVFGTARSRAIATFAATFPPTRVLACRSGRTLPWREKTTMNKRLHLILTTTLALSAAAFAQTGTPTTPSTTTNPDALKQDIQADKQDLKQDKQELQTAEQQVQQDKQKLAADKASGASKAQIQADRAQLKQDRHKLKQL